MPRIFKDANGKWRWLGISSSAYRDRDGEIVSQAALEKSVSRMDALGWYGDATWWHTDSLPLASCDFSGVHGPFLIESGVFYDDAIGKAFSEQDDLGISIEFIPLAEKDADGAYPDVLIFRRSFLPEERASNIFTNLIVTRKERTRMKIDELLKRLGGNKEAVEAVEAMLGGAEAAKTVADAVGLERKEEGDGDGDAGEQPEELDLDAFAKIVAKEAAYASASVYIEVMGPALKELTDAIGRIVTDTQTKEVAATKAVTEVQALRGEVATLKEALEKAETRLKELEGDIPESGYRASQSPDSFDLEALVEKALGRAREQNPEMAALFGAGDPIVPGKEGE